MKRLCFRGAMKATWSLAAGGIMCCLFAAGCRTTGVEIIEHGIYAARQSGKEATDGTTRGERVLLRDITLLEKCGAPSSAVGIVSG